MTDGNKPNVRYSVLKVDDNHTKHFKWLVDGVASQGINTKRHIIFCHRANDMTGLFRLFSTCLGDKQYVSLTNNLPNDCNQLFAMYHKKTDPDIQETVQKSFGTIDGVVRVLFCTIAFGMGVDVKGIHNVIDEFQDNPRPLAVLHYCCSFVPINASAIVLVFLFVLVVHARKISLQRK